MSPRISRSAFLRLTLSALPLLVSRPAVAALAAQALGADRRDRLASTIRTYQLYGVHRTASEVDQQSGQWLAGEASRYGAEVTTRPFRLDRIVLLESSVAADGVTREALPFFDSTFTLPGGVTGRVGPPDSGAPVALVSLNRAAIGSEGESLAPLRRRGDIKAIIAVTEGELPGLCPSNARAFTRPYGVPVLQVSSTAAPWLNDLAARGAEVRCTAAVTREPSTADNILATVHGRRPELPPVVVMTPRSGWWYCASERGGGLACWLEIVRAVADVRPDRTVRFIASSGHELGHLGLESFLRDEPMLIKSASAWLHLGACIGAAGGRTTLQSATDEIEATAVASLRRAAAQVDTPIPRGTVPNGEARNIHVAGGRYVSLLASGPHFHNPDDLWPDAVDLAALDRYAAAMVELALQLARA